MRSNAGYVDEIIGMWRTKNSPDFRYYEKYDTPMATDPFWEEGTAFACAFSQLDLSRTLEIACGTGRHSSRLLGRVSQLYLLDTSADAIRLARERFASHPHVEVLQSADGEGIPITDDSLTAIFSFDAMVHFEATTVANYLLESARVLVAGGRALFHHSIYDKNPTGRFHQNPGWRNFMSASLFAYLASRAGLAVISSIGFNERQGVAMIDGLSLVEKPPISDRVSDPTQR